MTASFRKKLARQDRLIGVIMTLPSPEIAEILALSGMDWLFVDLEHSALSIRDAQAILQAAEPETPCVVRAPSTDEIWMKKILDIGASGVIVPQIRTAEDAAAAVRFCKYPPEGSRSVGIARAHGYGKKFQEYVASANEETAVILQIEHIDAVNAIEAILAVPAIDCLFVGPYDLSASMGKTGQVDHPDVRNAMSQVKHSADRAKMPMGIFGATAEAVSPFIQEGYSLIAVGMDALLMGNAAREIAAALKQRS